MGAFLRFAQVVLRPAPDHIDAVVDEQLQGVRQGERARLAMDDGQHDHAERLLELRMLVEIVQDHFRLLAALQLNDNPHAIAVGLIADVGDALDFLVLHEFSDALNDPRFVDLEGNLRDDDLHLFLGGALDGGLGAHGELAAARPVGIFDPALAVDVSAGGEVGAGNERQHLVNGSGRLVQQKDGGLDDFRQIVGRNLGGHPHGDSVRTVDEQAGNPRGEDGGLLRGLVEVGYEIHGVFFDVGQHLLGQFGQAALRVPVSRRRVAIDGAKVALPINERIAHVEVLRHAHQGVVNRRVTVRVIFLDDLAHHTRALDVALVGGVALLVHRVQNAAVHRLQPVAHVGQRPADDHAHGVIEIRLAHLVFYVDGNIPRRLD